MVIDESPSYLRLSDGALLGAGQAALGASSVDAIGRARGAERADHRHPARHGAGRDDRGRARREPMSWSRTAESRTHRRPSPTVCPPRAHTEYMTTRSTRSPRRRTVVALAVVLAVLAGFIVRLVDIQVVNADDHIADSHAGRARRLADAVRHARRDRRRDRADAGGQHPALRRPVLDPKNVGPLTREDDDGDARRRAVEGRRRRDRRRSRGRPPRTCRRSSPTRSPRPPTRSSRYLKRGPDDRAVPRSRRHRRAVPHLRRAPRAHLPRRRGRRQPRRLHGHRRRPARRPREEPERLPARHERHARRSRRARTAS